MTDRVIKWASLAVLLSIGLNFADAADDYKLGPDSMRQERVPVGTVTKSKWISEKVFPGTERDMWVYVPAQYDSAKSACVMVIQDGGGYVNEKGQFRTPVVFDNLIHKKEMPVTIGIFLNPGVIPASKPGGQPRRNRSFVYDTLSDHISHLDELRTHGTTARSSLLDFAQDAGTIATRCTAFSEVTY